MISTPVIYQDPTSASENLRQTMSINFKRMSKRVLSTAALVALLSCSPVAADEAAVKYSVNTSDLNNNRLVVTATIPASVFPDRERVIALPVWTPGSYKVRDYSRFLGNVELLNKNGTIEKTSKNRWRISGLEESEAVQVRYQVYGHEISVRTNYFTPEFSLIVGAATFVAPAPLTSANGRRATYEVEFPGWTGQAESGLASTSGRFQAGDYDDLVDSPILLGDLKVEDLKTDPHPSRIVTAGPREYWVGSPYVEDIHKLVKANEAFWKTVPYKDYTFMNLITGSRGGLEHRNSTVVMSGPFTASERSTYLAWLETVAHEHFHTWNVKTLLPKALSEFDYETENYTSSLWIAEGFTAYYDALLVRRAGICSREEYLDRLAGELHTLATTPGRKAISLADASWDAWIRLYQDSDDLHNSNISYYGKGGVVAWLLDTQIRRSTDGKRSLDDVMRLAYQRFGQSGYEPKEFEKLASEVSGTDLTPFFQNAVYSTEELPIDEALAYWGLKWESSGKSPKLYLGVSLSNRDGRSVISKVFADSPAYRAGLAPGDELLSVDGNRLPADGSLDFLDYLPQDGKPHVVLVSRLGKVIERSVQLVKNPNPKRSLVFTKGDSSLDARRLNWLGPEKGNAR